MKEKRTGKLENLSYMILVAVFAALLICILLAESTTIFSTRSHSGIREITGYTFREVPDEDTAAGYYDEYTFRLKDGYRGTMSLAFYMVHSCCRVYIGDELIYTLSARPETLLFGKTPGNAWGVVPIVFSDTGKEVTVQIIPVYKNLPKSEIHFFIGDQSDIVNAVLKRSTPSLAFSVLLILIGIICFILSFVPILTESRIDSAEIRYLGFFTFLLGTWKISDLSLMTLLLPDRTIFLSFLTLTCLTLMPFALLKYSHARIHIADKAYHIFLFLFLILPVVFLLLQILNIRDLRENLRIIHVVLIAAIILTVYFSVQSLRKSRKQRGYALNLTAMLIMCLGVTADLVQYYLIDDSRDLVFTLVSVLLYILVTGVNYLIQMRHDAVLDETTGLYNKNQCRLHIESKEKVQPGTVFYMFDLNGLKTTNDVRGHEAGDHLIASFGKALKTASSRIPDAFVGRYGGDEFIVIYTSSDYEAQNEDGTPEFILRLQSIVNDMNRKDPSLGMSFSWGESVCEEGESTDLEKLMYKADMNMYLFKQEWYKIKGHDRRSMFIRPEV